MLVVKVNVAVAVVSVDNKRCNYFWAYRSELYFPTSEEVIFQIRLTFWPSLVYFHSIGNSHKTNNKLHSEVHNHGEKTYISSLLSLYQRSLFTILTREMRSNTV